jgi:hypothetical protein
LVFEAQNTGAISVITPIADHILLALTGPEPRKARPAQNGHLEDSKHTENGTDESQEEDGQSEEDEGHQKIRTDLELASQELARVLKEELSKLKWPEDI